MTDVGGKPLVEARVRLVADGTGLAQGAAAEGAKAGKSAGKAAATALSRSISDGLADGAAKAGKAGGDAGEKFADGFTRDAGGKLRDANGKFVAGAGKQIRDGLATSVTDGVEKGTDEATQATGLRGRFRRLGEQAGKAFGDGLTDTQAAALDNIGNRALVGGAALGAGFVVATKSFADFDKAISRAAAATVTAKENMGALEDAALKAGQETSFSATEAADAITELAKAGVSTQNILGGGLDAALALAAAGQLDVAESAEIAATAMNQFGLTGRDNITKVADLLAAGAGKAQGSVSDLANALKYVGPVAASVNVPIEETVGVLARLASQGILSETAGTSTRGFLASLLSPSQKASETLQELGVNVFDASGKFVGFAGAAEQLRTALAGASEAQREQALFTIFGRETVTAAKIIYEDGAKGVQDWTTKVDDSGYAAIQAGILMDNLAGDVERLGGSLETALVKGGSGANDGLRALTQAAEGTVNAFSSLPDVVQQTAVVLGGIGGAGLLATGGAIKAAGAVRDLRADLAELSVDTSGARTKFGALASFLGGPWGVAIGLGATALGAYAAQQGAAQAAVQELTDSLDEQTGALTSGSSGLIAANLKDAGAIDAAKALRVNLRDVQLAAEGNVGALARVNDEIARQRLLLSAGPQNIVNEQWQGQLDTLQGALDGSNETLAKSRQEFQDRQELLGEDAEATEELAGVTEEFGSAAGKAAGQASEMADALAELNEQAKEAADRVLSARQAARGYEEAVDAATEALKENGKTLDISNDKGRANQEALDGIAEAARANADAIFEATGDQDKYSQALERGRRKFIDVAQQMGVSKKKARELADELFGIPSEVDIRTRLKGVKAAEDAIRGLDFWIRQVDGTVINIGARAPSNPYERGYRSKGGWVPGRASEVDTEPYMLAKGEFVVRSREATKPANQRILEAMNAGEDISAGMRDSGAAAVVSAPVARVGGAGVDADAIVAAVTAGVAAGIQAGLSQVAVKFNGAMVGELSRAGAYTAGVDW